MEPETQNILERYEKRKLSKKVKKNSANFYFNYFSQTERELKYLEILNKYFQNIEDLKFIEIGAGYGINLFFFKKIGVKWDNIYANELLFERIKFLKEVFPMVNIIEGDACKISPEIESTFDIVFQSTVFTSILDFDFKRKLADKMWSLVKPGGIILWYDFVYNNPNNNDVKGISKSEIIELFPYSAQISFQKVTLAPPIGRRIAKLYPLINLFPLLRTHVIAVIEKKSLL